MGRRPRVRFPNSGPIAFPADGAPDLTFTRPTAIKLDGKDYEKKDLYWNNLLFDVVARAAQKLPTDQLKKIILVNYVDGKGAQDKGYRFIEDAKLSVQGQELECRVEGCIPYYQGRGHEYRRVVWLGKQGQGCLSWQVWSHDPRGSLTPD